MRKKAIRVQPRVQTQDRPADAGRGERERAGTRSESAAQGPVCLAHEPYRRLGRSAQARHEAYPALFQNAPEPAAVEGIRQATNGGFVLGSARFAREIAHALGRRVERGRPGRPARATEPAAP